MILPVTVLGDPLLRKVSQPLTKDYKNLDELIQNMFETMYQANGGIYNDCVIFIF